MTFCRLALAMSVVHAIGVPVCAAASNGDPAQESTAVATRSRHSTWRIEFGVRAGPNAVQAGAVAVGPVLGVRYHLDGPFFMAAAASGTWSRSATDDWQLARRHALAAVGFGLSATVGVGSVFALVWGGTEGIMETADRHDAERVSRLGITTARRGWSLAPYGAAELGTEVGFVRGWHVQAAVGPTVCRHRDRNGPKTRWGIHSRLGIAYAF